MHVARYTCVDANPATSSLGSDIRYVRIYNGSTLVPEASVNLLAKLATPTAHGAIEHNHTIVTCTA